MTSLLAALGLVFLAELGDKTQLLAVGLGARHRVGPVLAGMALGYGVSNLLSAVVGGLLGAALPTRALGLGGGLLFVVFGVLSLRRAADDEEVPDLPTAHVVRSVALTIFVAEAGDKTQLATAALAAQGSPVLVWVGATVGITLSGAVGVLVGRGLGARLPERALELASGVLFVAFGLVLLATSA